MSYVHLKQTSHSFSGFWLHQCGWTLASKQKLLGSLLFLLDKKEKSKNLFVSCRAIIKQLSTETSVIKRQTVQDNICQLPASLTAFAATFSWRHKVKHWFICLTHVVALCCFPFLPFDRIHKTHRGQVRLYNERHGFHFIPSNTGRIKESLGFTVYRCKSLPIIACACVHLLAKYL